MIKKFQLFRISTQVIVPITAILLLCPLLAPASKQIENQSSSWETSQGFKEVAKMAMPTVVFIKVEKKIQRGHAYGPLEYNNPFDLFNDEFFKRFFGHRSPHGQRPREYVQRGWGSGFIFSDKGYIMTNHHVVGDAEKISVQLSDGREYSAQIVGSDPSSDVAIIKVDEATDLPVLPLGDSDSLEVGEWVMAVGNPFGLSHTLTVGVVSAKGRTSVGITDYEDFIQTDAAINPGNSGGPLINLKGEAVGINSAIFSKSGGYMGIGFAIPINMVKEIKDQLIASGKVSRGYLGVSIQDITAELKEALDLESSDGVLVADVSKDSSADKAGLRRGDVVVEFDGQKVLNVGQFRNMVSLTPPGDEAKIVVIRDGKKTDLIAKLGTLEEATLASVPKKDVMNKLGFSVQDITEDLAQQFGHSKMEGVLISQVQPGSLANTAGLRAGMIILEVNRKTVRSSEEFYRTIAESTKSEKVLLLVADNQYSKYFVLPLK